MAKEKRIDFLKLSQDSMETLGFWTEMNEHSVRRKIEQAYHSDVIREWGISEIAFNKAGDKILAKWYKRFKPLTDSELKEEYGR